jgi:hypothetical protein
MGINTAGPGTVITQKVAYYLSHTLHPSSYFIVTTLITVFTLAERHLVQMKLFLLFILYDKIGRHSLDFIPSLVGYSHVVFTLCILRKHRRNCFPVLITSDN